MLILAKLSTTIFLFFQLMSLTRIGVTANQVVSFFFVFHGFEQIGSSLLNIYFIYKCWRLTLVLKGKGLENLFSILFFSCKAYHFFHVFLGGRNLSMISLSVQAVEWIFKVLHKKKNKEVESWPQRSNLGM